LIDLLENSNKKPAILKKPYQDFLQLKVNKSDIDNKYHSDRNIKHHILNTVVLTIKCCDNRMIMVDFRF